MSCHHIRIKSNDSGLSGLSPELASLLALSQALGQNYRMYKNRRLGNLSLLEILGTSLKHHIGDPPSENLVRLLKQLFCKGLTLVQILAHTGKLGTLARKYKCFHFYKSIKGFSGRKDKNFIPLCH